MGTYSRQLFVLGKRLAWVFVLYTFSRVLFYLVNKTYFQGIGLSELLSICFYGLRFDAFSILAINSLFILLSALPFAFVYSQGYQRSVKWLFLVTNAVGLLANYIDFVFFPFNQKRITYDVFHFAFGGEVEMSKLGPMFVREYWYVGVLCIASVWGLANRYNAIRLPSAPVFRYSLPGSIRYIVVFSLVVTLTVLGIRGGLQRVPIGLVDGGKYTQPQYVPVLINTPFSIIKSADLKTIQELHLMPDTQAIRYMNPLHTPLKGTFRPLNVCVIMLESFSKEYTGISNRKSYTPFLDSLMARSLLFTNAYANGKRSIEGIPAILASMPSLMEDPYLNSYYSNNTIQSLPNLLKQKGYYSAFFHGGTNGTMNFDAFCKMAGFDQYFGRTEYGNDADYDGQWGIWDEPFLKFTARKMGEFKQPFMAGIFTLSSHHPYKVPAQYTGKFPKGTLEIHETIGYADHALRQFFGEAKKQAWFSNTLFVLTPDHTGISEDPYYANIKGQYSIPIAFYRAGDSLQGMSTEPVQQIDIMPGILDELHFDKPYFCFGTGMGRQKHPCIYYSNSNYYVVTDSLFYSINDFRISQTFNYRRDSLLQHSLAGQQPLQDTYINDYTKAFMQTYNNAVIHNKTHR